MPAADADLGALARRFATADEFTTSPLSRALCAHAAGDGHLLRLAALGRPGQQPTYLLLGAVHRLLLGGLDHDLAGFYPSVVGPAAAGPPTGAGPALSDLGRRHADELAALIRTRLVQTNVVARSLALRVGLAAVRRHVDGPVHLVEVGASAGIHLRSDRWAYELGGRVAGDPRSPVRLTAELRGDPALLSDLDDVAPIATATGIDLHPIDATDPEERAWLEALVWPENVGELARLRAALGVVAADPPTIVAGDAVEACPRVAAALPPGEPRVAFHVATRMHVPVERRPAFDAAVESLGAGGPLHTISMDEDGLVLRGPDGRRRPLARADGHLDWIEPLAGARG